MSRFSKTIIFFVCVNLILAAQAVPSMAELKIGYIRSDYIFSKYEPYKIAETQLREFQKLEDDKLQKRFEDFQKKVKDADSKALLMTDETKRETADALRAEQEEIELSHENLFRENGLMAKKQSELLQPIIEKINEILMRIAKEDEYDYIFDATPGGILLYANDKYDISDLILEELGKEVASK